nr:Gfo/Idh/MocA family oxidoreductase [Cytophagales bacterium]
MNRKQFLQTAALAGASLLSSPFVTFAKPPSKYRTALIGSGWWGMNILRCAMQAGSAKVVALCDVDQRQLAAATAEVQKLNGDKPKLYKDYRELLTREKPEIVIVATPDHWHALPTIMAMQQGAHVYVEKPVGHTIGEGKAMLAAARKYGKVCQVGLHRRVSPHNKSGMDFLKSGKAGKIGMVRAFVHYGGDAGKVTPDAEPPKELDWDFWCGPAPLRAYNPNIHPRGFRQYLDFANGQLGDWGVHWLDQVLWWTEEKFPRRVYSHAARSIRRDSTDAPDTQVATFEFESFTAVWEHRLYAANNAEKGENVGCYFYGTEGTFHMGWQDGWRFYPADGKKPVIHEPAKLNQPDSQNIAELWADFLQAIEKNSHPVCDIESGHRSTNLSLLGMISHKVGRSLEWD